MNRGRCGRTGLGSALAVTCVGRVSLEKSATLWELRGLHPQRKHGARAGSGKRPKAMKRGPRARCLSHTWPPTHSRGSGMVPATALWNGYGQRVLGPGGERVPGTEPVEWAGPRCSSLRFRLLVRTRTPRLTPVTSPRSHGEDVAWVEQPASSGWGPCEIPREVMACALRGAPLPQGARGSWLVMWSLVSGCPFRLATE